MSVPTHQFIDEKPNFRVVSFDGKFWMHPYTASPIPLNNRHWREVAFEALSSESIGGSDEPLSLFKLLGSRWRMWLRDEIRNHPEACICNKSGHWINPITGLLAYQVQRPASRMESLIPLPFNE